MTHPRRYFNMKLEDYEPYKALNLPIGLFGPEPKPPTVCLHPKASLLEQTQNRLWGIRYQCWRNQQFNFDRDQWRFCGQIVRTFERLQDDESPIGCHRCESAQYTLCQCRCKTCGSPYCSGDCKYADE